MRGFVNCTCPADKGVSHAAGQPVERRSSSVDCSSGSYCALGVLLVFFMSCFMDTPGFCGSEALVRLAGLQATGEAPRVRTPKANTRSAEQV